MFTIPYLEKTREIAKEFFVSLLLLSALNSTPTYPYLAPNSTYPYLAPNSTCPYFDLQIQP
jgi:hypothetical protein